ncbi:putative inner membrane protein [Buttiauxella agrestis ATCC 33320]|uniref:UPF0756 membrane protein GBAG_1521 n=1 Tax=Buttiauxella agrestis ATCC 33320 TaxID=1006004 RepID=A0A085GF40_9ENTR|nr:putative inner membrane protein [Buttiauxella agrestis ATCC 33320]
MFNYYHATARKIWLTFKKADDQTFLRVKWVLTIKKPQLYFSQGMKMIFDSTLLILLALAGLGFVSHNTTVAVSILVLIIVRVTPLSQFFPWIEKQGLTVGIIILTIGVMAPIASGTLPASTLLHSFTNWKSVVAIVVGVFVSWLGGRGVTLMSSQPSLVAGLLVGTVLGVALFRGVPVGPLIAAGLVSLIVGKT